MFTFFFSSYIDRVLFYRHLLSSSLFLNTCSELLNFAKDTLDTHYHFSFDVAIILLDLHFFTIFVSGKGQLHG